MRKLAIFLMVAVWTSLLNAQWVQTSEPRDGIANGGGTGGTVNCFAVRGTNLFVGAHYGVFRSTDNGSSWTGAYVGLPWQEVIAFAVSGTNIFAGTNGAGVYLSISDGTSWSAVNTGLSGSFVTSLVVDGGNLFAGTSDGGVCISADNGLSWTPVNNGLTSTTVTSLAVSGPNLFAGTISGIFRSTNNGTNWTQVNNGLTDGEITCLGVSGTNIFAGTAGVAIGGGGIFLSTNSGSTWTQVNPGMTLRSIAAFAVSGVKVFAGTYGDGVFLTTDNGASWSTVNTGLTNTIEYRRVKSLAVSGTNLFASFEVEGSVWLRPLSEFPMPQTWYVNVVNGLDGYNGLSSAPGGMGVGPKQTINNAIAAASPGDIILVDYGDGNPYPETVNVTKRLTFGTTNNNGTGTPAINGVAIASGAPANTVTYIASWLLQYSLTLTSGAVVGGGNLAVANNATVTYTGGDLDASPVYAGSITLVSAVAVGSLEIPSSLWPASPSSLVKTFRLNNGSPATRTTIPGPRMVNGTLDMSVGTLWNAELTCTGSTVTMDTATSSFGGGSGLVLSPTVPPLTISSNGQFSLMSLEVRNDVVLAGLGGNIFVWQGLIHTSGILNLGSHTVTAANIYQHTGGSYAATTGYLVFSGGGANFQQGSLDFSIPNLRFASSAAANATGTGVVTVTSSLDMTFAAGPANAFTHTVSGSPRLAVANNVKVNYTSGQFDVPPVYGGFINLESKVAFSGTTIPASVWPSSPSTLVMVFWVNNSSAGTVSFLPGDRTVNGLLFLSVGTLDIGTNTLTCACSNVTVKSTSSLVTAGGIGVLTLNPVVPPLTFQVGSSGATIRNLTVSNDVVLSGGPGIITVTGTLRHTGGNLDLNSHTVTAGNVYQHTAGTYSATTGYLVFGGTGANFQQGNIDFSIPNLRIASSAAAYATGTGFVTVTQALDVNIAAGVANAFRHMTADVPRLIVADGATVNYTSGEFEDPPVYERSIMLVSTVTVSGTMLSATVWPESPPGLVQNLQVNNGGAGIAAQLPGPRSIDGNLTLINGTLDCGSNTLSLAGNFEATFGTFAPSTGRVTLNGGADQTISGSGIAFNNLALTKPSGMTTILAPVTVNGVLTLGANKITTGSSTLTIASGGIVTNTPDGYVIGNLQKYVQIGSPPNQMTFEVGDASNYTPVDLEGGGSTPGYLTVTTTPSVHPDLARSGINPAKYVKRYWTFTNSGIGGAIAYRATFYFKTGDVVGSADYHNFIVAVNSAGTWTQPNVGAKGEESIQVGGLTSFSDFAIGEPLSSTISGNAGVAGATLSYTDGTPKTATVDGTGAYSFAVSGDWSGVVTPSLGGNHFTPPYRSYSHVSSDQVSQNYIVAVASELQQIVLAPGYSAEYFYRNSPRFDGIAARGDGKLLVVMESAGNQGVYLATKGQWWNPADAYSSVGTPFNSPDDMIFARNGTTYVVDNGSWEVIQIPVGGGVATPFVTRTSIPTFDPLGITIAPVSFNGTNVKPGDLIVADNALGGPARAVWAIDPATRTVRGAIAQGPLNFNDGPLQVAFGLDGRLFVYENSSGTGYGRIVTIDAAGNVKPFLTNIPGNGNLAIHPVTGDIFFTVWKSGVPSAKTMRIPAKIIPPQTYPGSAVEVASGFSSLQDMEFSSDGNTLFVSARINTTWDILTISTPPQLSVDWYVETPTAEDHMFRGIAVDKTGSRVYISDSQTDMVYIFPNNGSNVPISSFGHPSWRTIAPALLGPYGIDVSDDDYVYIAVWKTEDANNDGYPDHALWRSNLDGGDLTQLCILPDPPRGLHVSGTGVNTVVYISGTSGRVIRCVPVTTQQFLAQTLYPTGVTLNQQDVLAGRSQSAIYVSSVYATDTPYDSPVTKWNVAGNRDVGFFVGSIQRGNTPGIDLDQSESALYLFNIEQAQPPSPPGLIAETKLYKVSAATGAGISGVVLGSSIISAGTSYAGGGMNIGRDGRIYVARTVYGNGNYVSAWGRVTDLLAATPPEFQAPAGTASEVYAEGIVRPVGLAVDGLHRLLVAESGTGNIYRYDSKTSKVLLAYGFDKPFDLLLKGDVLYVVDQVAGKIFEKNISVGTAPFSKSSFSEFSSNLEGPTYAIPGDLAGYSGKLLVSAGGGIRLAGGGNSVFMNASTSGSAVPQGMVITPTGDMYVCVQGAGTTLKAPLGISTPVDPKTLASVLSGLDSPGGIALGTDDRLYVATKDNVVVSRRDSRAWTPFIAGLSGGEFNNIEYAGNGEFYVADYLGNRILRVALPQTQRAPSSFPLVYKINESGHPNITDGTAFTAIQNSFQHWQDIPTSAATFQDGGRTSSKYASMNDGVNLVTFADDQFPFPPGVLAVVAKTLQMDPGEQTATIIDADVVFNPEFVHKTLWGLSTDTYPGLPDSLTFDIESIATHEIGHILGLIHSGAPPASMFFVLQPRKNGRTLKPDDIAWASYRYPAGNFNTAYGSIEGKVLYGYNQSKPVAGALLIARNYSTGAYYHSYSDVNGNYHIPGLTAGSYHVLLRALNGKVFGYPMTPANVSAYLYAITSITDYPGEWYSQGESSTDNPHDSTLVSVVAGQPTKSIDLITNVDAISPFAEGVSPANLAQQVDVFTQVVITFSEAVNPSTVGAATVTLKGPSGSAVSGTYLLVNSNKALVFTPARALSSTTVYTVTVTGGVQDPKGNFLSPTFTSKFTTGQSDQTAPTVTQVIPVRDSTGVLATSPIYVRFSKRMDPATITPNFSVYDSANGSPVSGTITVTQDNTVAMFTPSSTLSDGRTFKISVSTGASDASGLPLATAFLSGFKIVSGPPTIVTIGPTDGATSISVTSPVYADFSKSIDPATANSKSISLTVDGSLVGGTFEFLKDNSRVIFRPSVSLQFGKTYQIAISTDIKDLLNNSLTAGRTTTFQTAALLQTPVITAMDPPAATPGTTVAIAGRGFDPNPSKNQVTFGAIIVGASSSSETEITTVVPDGAYAGFVEVKVAKQGRQSGAYLFDVLIPLLSTQDNIIAGASTESQPTNADITPDGTLALVTNFASNTVSVIGLKSAQPTIDTPIPVGKNPYDVAITPDGKRAYVTNYGSNSVSVIALATKTVIGTIGVGMNPMGIAVTITPDGDRICVANSGSNSLSVIDGDPNSGMYNQIIAGASTESSPKDVEVSPDGTLAFVTAGRSLLIIDINPKSASYDHIIGQASTTSETKDVDVTPDGTIAIVTAKDGSILLVDVFPKSPGFGGIIAGASSTSGADHPEVSPDGMRVYVTSRASNTLLVYDLLYAPGVLPGTVSGIVTTGITLKLNHTVAVGTAPTGIAIDPHNTKVVVVNSGSNNVTIISVSGVSDVVLRSLGQLIGKTQTLIDRPGTSKQAAGHLKKAEDALRDAEGLITGGDISHAFDRFREAIHELGLASSATVVVSDIISSLAQAAAKLVQDALTAARAFPTTSQVNKQIADAEADVQKAKAYQVKGDFEKAMTSYKNAWDKAQLAIKLAQQSKGSNGGKPQGTEAAFEPTELALGQNYPNPFNSTTQIVFDIPVGETGGLFVELKVYNILGQLVRTLVNEVKAPGQYVVSWNGRHDDGRPTASGMYLVRFKAGNFQQTRRIVLIQ